LNEYFQTKVDFPMDRVSCSNALFSTKTM